MICESGDKGLCAIGVEPDALNALAAVHREFLERSQLLHWQLVVRAVPAGTEVASIAPDGARAQILAGENAAEKIRELLDTEFARWEGRIYRRRPKGVVMVRGFEVTVWQAVTGLGTLVGIAWGDIRFVPLTSVRALWFDTMRVALLSFGIWCLFAGIRRGSGWHR